MQGYFINKEYKKITRDNAKNETKRLIRRLLEIKN